MANKLRLTIFSVACCHPETAVYDRKYIDLVKKALTETGIEADMDMVTATESRLSIRYYFVGEIMPMYKKYGAAVAPALFINEHLKIYGGLPSMDKLKEVLTAAVNDTSLATW